MFDIVGVGFGEPDAFLGWVAESGEDAGWGGWVGSGEDEGVVGGFHIS